jgi:hypothetical protein
MYASPVWRNQHNWASPLMCLGKIIEYGFILLMLSDLYVTEMAQVLL